MKSLKEMVGEQIKRVRESPHFDISQPELAENIGVEKDTISRWERGLSWPEAENLEALSTFFHMPVKYFFDDKLSPGDFIDERIKALVKRINDEQNSITLLMNMVKYPLRYDPLLFALEKLMPPRQKEVLSLLGFSEEDQSELVIKLTKHAVKKAQSHLKQLESESIQAEKLKSHPLLAAFEKAEPDVQDSVLEKLKVPEEIHQEIVSQRAAKVLEKARLRGASPRQKSKAK